MSERLSGPIGTEKETGRICICYPELVVRLCFAVPFAWNVLCALQFVAMPDAYVGAYQLDGAGGAGSAAIRGLGVAFLMWNATYPLFLWSPSKYRILGFVILAQQAIGLLGELLILGTLFGAADTGAAFAVLSGSIMRFAAFDLAGLVIMGISFTVFCHSRRNGKEPACMN